MPDKSLGDWTLAEVKAECARRSNCNGCPLALVTKLGCRVGERIPYSFKLDKETEVS